MKYHIILTIETGNDKPIAKTKLSTLAGRAANTVRDLGVNLGYLDGSKADVTAEVRVVEFLPLSVVEMVNTSVQSAIRTE